MIRGLNTIISDLLTHLQQSAFRDIAGSRASLRIPVARPLLNALVAQLLHGRRAPVKSIDVRPHDHGAIDLIVAVTWPFVPALKVGLTIERQPVFPESPILVLHWTLLGGLGTIASRFIGALEPLPPGIKLDGEFIVLDIPVLMQQSSRSAAVLPYIRKLQVLTREGRLVLETDLEITPPSPFPRQLSRSAETPASKPTPT